MGNSSSRISRVKPSPDGWRLGTFADVIDSLDAGVSVNGEERPLSDSDIGVLKVSAVTYGTFDPKQVKAVIPSDRNRVAELVEEGRIIISRSNSPELVGASARVVGKHPRLYLSDKLWQVKPKDNVCESWLAHHLQLTSIRRRLSRLGTGTSNSMKNITKHALLGVSIRLPEFEEQKEIAEKIDFSTQMVERFGALLNACRKRRQGLMQQLLTGKRRFPGFSRPWKKVPLRDVLTESVQRNQDLALDGSSVLSVTKSNGMVPMKEHIRSDDLSRYKIVKQNWYAYNPMRINVGSICQWEDANEVLVSPDYVVFYANTELVDVEFFNAFRRGHQWNEFMRRAGNGSVRVRIYFDDLGKIQIQMPQIDEQRRIGKFYTQLNIEIQLLENLLKAYQRQKIAIMQRLLTGKLRIRAAGK